MSTGLNEVIPEGGKIAGGSAQVMRDERCGAPGRKPYFLFGAFHLRPPLVKSRERLGGLGSAMENSAVQGAVAISLPASL